MCNDQDDDVLGLQRMRFIAASRQDWSNHAGASYDGTASDARTAEIVQSALLLQRVCSHICQLFVHAGASSKQTYGLESEGAPYLRILQCPYSALTVPLQFPLRTPTLPLHCCL